MPKSKKNKVVALTQTTKKTREHKANLIQEIRDATNMHKSLYIFSFENMRSTKFTNVRKYFHNDGASSSSMKIVDENDDDGAMDTATDKKESSRLFLGKNKLMQIALGRTIEEEHDTNLSKVSKHISGSVGILCTSKSIKEIEQYFASINEDDYARGGSTVTISEPVIITNKDLESFQTTMVDQFRKLGLPVDVIVGKVCLVGRDEYALVKKGENVVLSVETCKLLHLFKIKLAKFRLNLVCRWEKDGNVEEY